MYTKVICTKYNFCNCHKYSNFHKTTEDWYSLVAANTNKTPLINKTINVILAIAIILKLALLNTNVTAVHVGTQKICECREILKTSLYG